MKVIYVAGPYVADSFHDIQINIATASKTALKCWRKGWAVICPHANTAYFHTYFDDDYSAPQIMNHDLELLRRCDAIVMLPGWENSKGSRVEHELAKELGKQVFYGHDAVPYLNCGR